MILSVLIFLSGFCFGIGAHMMFVYRRTKRLRERFVIKAYPARTKTIDMAYRIETKKAQNENYS